MWIMMSFWCQYDDPACSVITPWVCVWCHFDVNLMTPPGQSSHPGCAYDVILMSIWWPRLLSHHGLGVCVWCQSSMSIVHKLLHVRQPAWKNWFLPYFYNPNRYMQVASYRWNRTRAMVLHWIISPAPYLFGHGCLLNYCLSKRCMYIEFKSIS